MHIMGMFSMHPCVKVNNFVWHTSSRQDTSLACVNIPIKTCTCPLLFLPDTTGHEMVTSAGAKPWTSVMPNLCDVIYPWLHMVVFCPWLNISLRTPTHANAATSTSFCQQRTYSNMPQITLLAQPSWCVLPCPRATLSAGQT